MNQLSEIGLTCPKMFCTHIVLLHVKVAKMMCIKFFFVILHIMSCMLILGGNYRALQTNNVVQNIRGSKRSKSRIECQVESS